MGDTPWLQRGVNTLYEITRAINASLSREEVLSVMLERICVDLGYKAATLRLLDEERQELELTACFGLSAQYLAKGSVQVARSGVDRTVLAGQRIALADVKRDAGFQYSEAAAREGRHQAPGHGDPRHGARRPA